MVEARLDRGGTASPATAAATATATAGAILAVGLVITIGVVLPVLFLFVLLVLLLVGGVGRLGGGERRGLDLGLDLVTEIVRRVGLGVGVEIVAAPELAQLRGRDVELVRDPGVGPPLAHPGADLVQL